LVLCFKIPVRAEIRDVMKSADIDTTLSQSKPGEHSLHTQSNFSILAGVREGSVMPAETPKDAGTFVHIRKRPRELIVSGRKSEVARGDLLHVPAMLHIKSIPQVDESSIWRFGSSGRTRPVRRRPSPPGRYLTC
jgi:hypothetical protein